MPLETASTIAELNSSWPLGSSDTPASIDDHIQLIKSVLKADGMGASTVHAATSKATPVDADEIPLADSATSWGLKKLTWANLKATLKTWIEATPFSGLTSSGSVTMSGTESLVQSNSNPMLMTVGGAERMRIDTSGNVVVTNAGGGLGYGTGAGGTVTQATSKSTAVTLNKPTGQITMNNAALAASAQVEFTLSNSLISPTDVVVLTFNETVVGSNYNIWAGVGGGAAIIRLKNISGASLSQAVVINFAIIKGATS